MAVKFDQKAYAKAHAKILGKGGYLDQAKKAKAKGVLGDFLKQLLDQLGPMIGPIIVQIILSLLHIPVPVVP